MASVLRAIVAHKPHAAHGAELALVHYPRQGHPPFLLFVLQAQAKLQRGEQEW